MQFIKTFSHRLLRKDFIRFCIVGALGFVINVILLKIFLEYIHLRIYIAQAIASEIALFSNFLLHHNWTYKKSGTKKNLRQLALQFHASSWVAIIGSALIVSVAVNTFQLPVVLALIISSVVALFWNFFWSKYIIWRKLDNNSENEVNQK